LSLDVLYLTHNRRAFTELTFELLVENTNWDLVDRRIVYDAGSIDGAREEVVTRLDRVPVPSEIRDHDFHSPVAVMNDYIRGAESDLFAKVDNDLALPPAWLDAFVDVMSRYPDLQLLGSESPFMGPPPVDWNGVYTYTSWRHIGGNGLMRTKFFTESGPMDVDGYHGFTGHQWRWNPIRGWITPDILLCLLDRCPIEPWVSLSKEYVRQGWQRDWSKISPRYSIYWDWFTKEDA
jgi:hypothetical protein